MSTKPDINNLKIIVLSYGWVFVGYVTQTATHVYATHVKNIRTWGTKSGLGELACDGPTKSTVLDPVGSIQAPLTSLVCLLDVNPDKWQKF